jgi:cyclomaltodextrinase
LPYLQKLGINAIWLSPINAGPDEDFGYAVTDYFSLKPRAGTKEDLSELVALAHDLGIRVLMDFVPNHTSSEHPWFRDAESRGHLSPYYSFYQRDENGQPTHYFDWTKLPNLNFDNPEVRETVQEAFVYWVREFEIDGYRVDVAWGIKERASDFWSACRQELDRVKPGAVLLAEASARDPYYIHNGFDAAYDWTDELGHWAWEDVFASRDGITGRLRTALTNDGRGYDPATVNFDF